MLYVISALLAVGLIALDQWVKWWTVTNIGGAASAHIVATAYDSSFAAIGVLMGLLGGAVGNFFGLGMGALLQALFL